MRMRHTNPMNIFDAMDQMFGHTCNHHADGADMTHGEGNFTVELEVPGFSKKDIDIQLEDGVLSVTAGTESDEEQPKENGTTYLHKGRRRNFHYRIAVGPKCDKDSIKAKLELGILTITYTEKDTRQAIQIN